MADRIVQEEGRLLCAMVLDQNKGFLQVVDDLQVLDQNEGFLQVDDLNL